MTDRATTEPDPTVGLAVRYRVRFDESTPESEARTSILLRYAQDAAWRHSDLLGFDRAWYAERGLTWLVRSVELVVEGRVGSGLDLVVTTRITGYRKVWARRLTTFDGVDGTRRGWAHTDWVIVDGRGQPTRVPEVFPALVADPPGAFEPVRVALPEPPPEATVWRSSVRRSDLDPLDHVNNGTYVDYLEDAVAASAVHRAALVAVPRRYRLEYAGAAGSAMALDGRLWKSSPDDLAFSLRAADGTALLRATLRS